MMRFLSLIAIVFLNLSMNVQAEDTAKDRAKALISAELAFGPSVFSGGEFPSLVWMIQWKGFFLSFKGQTSRPLRAFITCSPIPPIWKATSRISRAISNMSMVKPIGIWSSR